jgi:hypothetical protein
MYVCNNLLDVRTQHRIYLISIKEKNKFHCVSRAGVMINFIEENEYEKLAGNNSSDTSETCVYLNYIHV